MSSLSGKNYKSFNTYNQYGEGSVKGPQYNGPDMSAQKIPQYPKGVGLHSLQHNQQHSNGGHFKMQHAYPAMKGADAVCATDFNFRDCSGKNMGKADGVIKNQASYSQAKYDNFL